MKRAARAPRPVSMTTQSVTIALKVDIDTYVGTRDGVPRLLEIMRQAGVRGSFYFSMGPDNSGKAIRRLVTRRGFLKKVLKSRALSACGIRTMLYGTLIPPPMIAESLPHILNRVAELGHEVGIHAWDHVKWDDLLPWMPKQTTLMELGRASALFQEIMGCRTKTTAAPGWRISEESLEIQDAMLLSHCSDTRGSVPFYPVLGQRQFATLQIPTTLPTIDELIGENGITADTVNDRFISLIRPGLNVHTVQAELEGMVLAPVFAELVGRLKAMGVRFVTLAEVAAEWQSKAANCPVTMARIAGRAGEVALQGAA